MSSAHSDRLHALKQRFKARPKGHGNTQPSQVSLDDGDKVQKPDSPETRKSNFIGIGFLGNSTQALQLCCICLKQLGFVSSFLKFNLFI